MGVHPEIVLPCLDEAEALPAVLASMPRGWPVLVVDNGSTDDTAAVARAHGARVVTEPRRGYGAAVHAGLEAARGELVAVLDGDGSLDPGVLPGMAAAVAAGADLAAGRRVPSSRGVWPWHARAANVVIAGMLRRRGVAVHDIAPVRVARREALLGLGVADRAFGYPLELLLRAGAAGWRIVEVPVPYGPRAGGRSKVSGSVRGTLRAGRGHGRAAPVSERQRANESTQRPSRSADRAQRGSAVSERQRANESTQRRRGALTERSDAAPTLGLLVLAKAPEPGLVKTRLCPPLTGAQAADVAAAALLDTLAAVGALPGGRVVVALAGRLRAAARRREVGAALRAVTVVDQHGPDLGHRIAAAHAAAAALLPGRPVLQLGMDTPQVEAALLDEAVAPLRCGSVDAVLGPAADGGWWALGLRDPRVAAVIADVPTSRDDTGERTLHALRRAGLRVGLLPELTDVDTIADVATVARAAPRTLFATAVAALPRYRAGAA